MNIIVMIVVFVRFISLDERYNEIREYLRKQHSANRNDVRLRYHSNGYICHYEEDEYNDNKVTQNKSGSDFLFFFKIILFLVAVLTFSCYIYGGQNLQSGFDMAVSEAYEQIEKLERDNETVRETMAGVRSVWHKVKDFAGE